MHQQQVAIHGALSHLRNRLQDVEQSLAGLQRLTQDRESLKSATYALEQVLKLGSKPDSGAQGQASLQDTLSHMRTSLHEVEEQLAGLEQLMQDREVIKRALNDLEQVVRLGSGEPIEREEPLWQGARDLLVQNGGPMSVQAITEALLARGWRVEGKTPVESVRSALLRKPEIFDRGPGHSFLVRPNVENRRARLG